MSKEVETHVSDEDEWEAVAETQRDASAKAPEAPLEERLGNYLADQFGQAQDALDVAAKSTSEAFAQQLKAGSALATAKAEWDRNGGKPAAFNKYADEHLMQVTKQWRNRLIQVAAKFELIRPAFEQLPESDKHVTKAIAMIREAEKASRGEGSEGEDEGGGSEAKPKALSKSELQAAVDDAEELFVRLQEMAKQSYIVANGRKKAAAEEFGAVLDQISWWIVNKAGGEPTDEFPFEEDTYEDTSEGEPEVDTRGGDATEDDKPQALPLSQPTKIRVKKLMRQLSEAEEKGDGPAAENYKRQLRDVATKHHIPEVDLAGTVGA